MARTLLIVVLAATVTAAMATPARATLTIAQLQGKTGCLADPPQPSGCRATPGLDLNSDISPNAAVVSPDGENLYVAAGTSSSLAVFKREDTGAVQWLECFGSEGFGCADGGSAMEDASSVAVSPDGRHVYVTGTGGRGITVFRRDVETGRLQRASCIQETGKEDCTQVGSLDRVTAAAFSPDGAHLYAAVEADDTIWDFLRDPASGALSPNACWQPDPGPSGCLETTAPLDGVSSLAMSPDGASLYSTSRAGDALVRFSRDATTGSLAFQACVSARSQPLCSKDATVDGPQAVAVSPAGTEIYLASGSTGTLGVYRPAGGALERVECFGVRTLGGCAPGHQLVGAASVAVSPDGRSVFVASAEVSHSLTQFQRNEDGTLIAPGCISDAGTYGACTSGRGVQGARAVTVDPTSRNVYMLSYLHDSLTVYAPVAGLRFDYLTSLPSGILKVPLECPPVHEGQCRGTVRIELERRKLPRGANGSVIAGHGAYRIDPGSSGRAVIRVSRAGRRLGGRLRDFVIRAYAEESGPYDETRLRLPVRQLYGGDRFVGLASDDVFRLRDPFQRSVTLEQQAQLGVRVIRQMFRGSRLEPKRGQYSFEFYDAYVADLARRGLQVLPVLVYPERRGRLAALAKRLVQRYGPRGTFWRSRPGLPRLPVRAWQVWDAPNTRRGWAGRPSARRYTSLLRHVGRAVKREQEGAIVITGGLDPRGAGTSPSRFLDRMYAAGARGSFDAVGLNPWSESVEELSWRLHAARAVMDRRGDGRRGIWITSFGWADRGRKSPYTKGRRGQARNIRSAIRLFGRLRGPYRLRGFVYDDWRDDSAREKDSYARHTGLVGTDARPKPALTAFRRAVTGLPMR